MSSRVYKEFGNNGRVLVHAFGAFGDRGNDNRDCRMNKDFRMMERSTAIVKGTKGEFGRGFLCWWRSNG